MAPTQSQLEAQSTAQPVGTELPRRRIAIVTGSRAEFGLLRPVIKAVRDHRELELLVVAGGAHLLKHPRFVSTIEEVRRELEPAAIIVMQEDGDVGRIGDACALGRGVVGFAEAFDRLKPDWVVVLGDRIEAFAAASAASVGGWAVAHIHGGDRAEGIADEAMRHAITKLSHLHLAASEESAERIIRMGERAEHVHFVGSPAIDELATIRELDDPAAAELGDPDVLLLVHPIGRSDVEEYRDTIAVIDGLRRDPMRRILALEPNHDPGREGVVKAITESGLTSIPHLERAKFVGLLRRVGVLVGNSSAGLIEAAALGCPVVNIGPRQAGRFTTMNVVSVMLPTPAELDRAVRQAVRLRGEVFAHPFGTGEAGIKIAASLAKLDPHDPALLRKHNTY